jgi:hypothetical protein
MPLFRSSPINRLTASLTSATRFELASAFLPPIDASWPLRIATESAYSRFRVALYDLLLALSGPILGFKDSLCEVTVPVEQAGITGVTNPARRPRQTKQRHDVIIAPVHLSPVDQMHHRQPDFVLVCQWPGLSCFRPNDCTRSPFRYTSAFPSHRSLLCL